MRRDVLCSIDTAVKFVYCVVPLLGGIVIIILKFYVMFTGPVATKRSMVDSYYLMEFRNGPIIVCSI